jgi:hypothetical protein
MWHRVVLYKYTDVLAERSVSFFEFDTIDPATSATETSIVHKNPRGVKLQNSSVSGDRIWYTIVPRFITNI